jgi:O-succinylbenzoate synthase
MLSFSLLLIVNHVFLAISCLSASFAASPTNPSRTLAN